MLVIGSRALHFHFPYYKKEVNDWDFIGTENEIKYWLQKAKQQHNDIFFDSVDYVNLRLYYAKINNLDYEFYVSKPGYSDQDYLDINNEEGVLKYANKEILYSILTSHIHREEAKEKHILDYLFLKNILKKDNLKHITYKRIIETNIRLDSLKTKL